MSDSEGEEIEALELVEKHLNNPNQSWLLGAGISFDAKIPLMFPLTDRVSKILEEEYPDSYGLYTHIKSDLPEADTHVEHILSHIGDLISLSGRSGNQNTEFHGKEISKDDLEQLHKCIVEGIRRTIRYGYKQGTDGSEDIIGTAEQPIVDISTHRSFVKSLFGVAQAGVGSLRPRVEFFTINYDTLLEDALSFEEINWTDGFSGGAVGFWDNARFSRSQELISAGIYKLHGSIDWHINEDRSLIKCRDNLYPESERGEAIIYPQQTKYLAAQRDPFSQLFQHFRLLLASPRDQVLGICGYSFGDEHINLEIESALSHPKNNTTLICFVKEFVDSESGKSHLPKTLQTWLSQTDYSKRIFVLSDLGLYWGNTTNLKPTQNGSSHTWWAFKGVINLITTGLH